LGELPCSARSTRHSAMPLLVLFVSPLRRWPLRSARLVSSGIGRESMGRRGRGRGRGSGWTIEDIELYLELLVGREVTGGERERMEALQGQRRCRWARDLGRLLLGLCLCISRLLRNAGEKL
jgi:hypothetical protein